MTRFASFAYIIQLDLKINIISIFIKNFIFWQLLFDTMRLCPVIPKNRISAKKINNKSYLYRLYLEIKKNERLPSILKSIDSNMLPIDLSSK